MVNTILKEVDLFCPNSVRINFTIYHFNLENISSSIKTELNKIVHDIDD
ncbi:ABC transporter ATP-binding protein [Lactiplantibacillus plantarum]|nr:ABC transporter ATP-binding protein [Lactiplantibacillus plantarum]MCT3230337.1 ABC transporter ATP-binding protein [Lactiplantibacillus plantarum]MCT3239439.1 ABC transporter ATP-binding protein [Lactiplantibacillus plantarum]MCT3256745.1 ABC transporter ATP-binding protein [Lactiplantibacillus plantarum]MDN7016990.1 ABC transporter ATP-binding protein [Lactiplantibacillus plantarum]